MFIDSAAAVTDHPASIRRHNRNRPSGVKGALAGEASLLGSVCCLNSSTLAQEAQHSADVNNVPRHNT